MNKDDQDVYFDDDGNLRCSKTGHMLHTKNELMGERGPSYDVNKMVNGLYEIDSYINSKGFMDIDEGTSLRNMIHRLLGTDGHSDISKPITINQRMMYYASKGVFLSMGPDAYKGYFDDGDNKCCWRGCFTWKGKDGEWKSDDAGCYPDINDAYKSLFESADWIIDNKFNESHE